MATFITYGNHNNRDILPLRTLEGINTSEPSSKLSFCKKTQMYAEVIKEKWYKIDKDDKIKDKKRAPLETKHYTIYTIVSAVITSLAVLLSLTHSTPMIIESATGPMMNNTNMMHKQTYPIASKKKEETSDTTSLIEVREEPELRKIYPLSQCIFEGLGAVTLALSTQYLWLKKFFPDNLFVRIFNSLPLFDIFAGVYLKGVLAEVKWNDRLHAFLQNKGFHLPEKLLKAACLALEGIAAMALMNPRVFGPYMAASAGIFAKTKMRKLIDMSWKKMGAIESTAKRHLTFALAYLLTATTLAVSALGVKTLPQNSALAFLSIMGCIVSLDTLMRTAKKLTKTISKVEKKIQKKEGIEPSPPNKLLQVTKASLLFGSIAGVAYGVGKHIALAAEASRQNTGLNPGLVATLSTELGMVIKVSTKELLPPNIMLALSSALTLASVAYTILSKDPLSRLHGAATFVGILSMNILFYFVKDELRSKAPKDKTNPV